MKRPLLAFLTVLLAAGMSGAAAQLRTIPAEAKRATLRHVQDMVVELDGKPARLTPGAQIRDTSNRLILPTSITQAVVVKFLADPSGQQLHRVWILSAEEAAQSAPKPAPKPLPAPEPKADEKKAGS